MTQKERWLESWIDDAKGAKALGSSMKVFEPFIKNLVAELNEASLQYYNGEPTMTDKEFDTLYDCLKEMEQLTGFILPNSPTQVVGANPDENNAFQKVVHDYPARSLDKTKDVDEMVGDFRTGIEDAFDNGYDHSENVVIMWKEDGSTLVPTYKNGSLILLATRGNGEVGYDVTQNAPYVEGLPMKIDFKGDLVVRGECLMSYDDFTKINEALPEGVDKYKNARNLANASIQLHSTDEVAKRHLQFRAFDLVYSSIGAPNIFSERLEALKAMGFAVVPYESVHIDNLKERIEAWSDKVEDYEFPVDGLVLALEDTMYADTLPGTNKHPNIMKGYALKWQDETVETILRDIEWSPSRTGLLNPVAIFDPVELEGTTVSRASLHNISYIMEKDLRVGDKITIYKANKIIPQVAVNLTAETRDQQVKSTGNYKIAQTCPVCGEVTGVHGMDADVMTLHCNNPHCAAKQVGKLVHFCERDCMNINGLSDEKIEFLLLNRYIHNISDLFNLKNQKTDRGIMKLDMINGPLADEPGWGTKSVDNLLDGIEAARKANFIPFIHALGIPNVGKGQAKLIKPACNDYALKMRADGKIANSLWDAFVDMVACNYDFSQIEGIGPVINNNIHTSWVAIDIHREKLQVKNELFKIVKNMIFADEITDNNSSTSTSAVAGKTFVITGSLNNWPNRDALVADIEAKGGKVSGSVSKNTDFLVNNDVNSTSGKNKKAKELGIEIIDEATVAEMLK